MQTYTTTQQSHDISSSRFGQFPRWLEEQLIVLALFDFTDQNDKIL